MSILRAGQQDPAAQGRRRIALGLLILVAAAPLRAQRHTDTNVAAWFSFNGDVALDDRWGLTFDASYRRAGPLSETQAIFARPGISYEISPNVRIAVGMSRSESYPYGKVPNPYAYPESRAWEQLVLSQTAGRIAIQHRYRLEQRWQGARGADTSDHAIDHWVRLSRARYQLRATVPLRGEAVAVHSSYLALSNEILIGFGRNVRYNVFDSNRAALTLGWRATESWRAELGYLNQLLLKSDGHQVEDNHTVTLTLGLTRAPRGRKAKRQAQPGS